MTRHDGIAQSGTVRHVERRGRPTLGRGRGRTRSGCSLSVADALLRRPLKSDRVIASLTLDAGGRDHLERGRPGRCDGLGNWHRPLRPMLEGGGERAFIARGLENTDFILRRRRRTTSRRTRSTWSSVGSARCSSQIRSPHSPTSAVRSTSWLVFIPAALAANQWLTVPGAALPGNHAALPGGGRWRWAGMFAQSDPDTVTAVLRGAGLTDVALEATEVSVHARPTIDAATSTADSGTGTSTARDNPREPSQCRADDVRAPSFADHHDGTAVLLGGVDLDCHREPTGRLSG